MNDEDFHEGLDQPEVRAPETYIVSRDFTTSVNGASVAFRRGALLRDESLLAVLLAGRAPLVKILNEMDLGTCPHCGLSFSLSSQGDARELLSRARQLMPGYV